MKFKVNTKSFLAGLSSCAPGLGTGQVLPILESFYFSLDNGELTIRSTDTELSIATIIRVAGETNGTAAIPGKILTDTISALPNQDITIEVKENNQVVITSPNGKYKLASDNAADFPNGMKIEGTPVTIPGLQEAVRTCLFATSHDELRPAMTGVFLDCKGNLINAVATDAHKLVKYSLATETEINGGYIFPKKFASAVKDLKGELEITFADNAVEVTNGDVTITSTLINYNFPPYEAVIPTDNDKTLSLNPLALKASLKRLKSYANRSTNQVVLTLNSKVELYASDLEFSNEAKEELSGKFQGDEMQIGFNAQYLSDCVSHLTGDEVSFKLKAANAPALLEGENKAVTMLIMPVIIS